MTFIVSAFLSIFGGLFDSKGRDTLDLFEKQKEAGYSWHYTGSMLPPPNTKFFSLKSGSGKDIVLFQLRRDQLEPEIADLED